MGAYTGEAVRNRYKALNESDLRSDGVTITVTRPGGTNPPAQTVDVVYKTQDPTDPNVQMSTPTVFAELRGDMTLDLQVEDRFEIDGVRFEVIQPALPDDGRQWKKKALAKANR